MTDVLLIERVFQSLTQLAARDGVGAVADVLRDVEGAYAGDVPGPVLGGLRAAANRIDDLAGREGSVRAPAACQRPVDELSVAAEPTRNAAPADSGPPAATAVGLDEAST